MTDQSQHTEQIWTLKEVAARLRISVRTMHNLLDSGKIEGMLIANRWKFSEQAIKAYEESSKPKEGKGAKKKRTYTKRTA